MITLVFLHGLLGNKDDWQDIVNKLPHIPTLCIDLPFHNGASDISVTNFEETVHYINEEIRSNIGDSPYILAGYSLGGRIALYYAFASNIDTTPIKAVILEGANLGLTTDEEKQQRWLNDFAWAERFAQENIDDVLNDWYQQPVFSHLDAKQREKLIQKRTALQDKTTFGKNIAKMLTATSLAKQPDFSEKIHSELLPVYYIVGEKDQKFKDIALNNHISTYVVENAGHNSHEENSAQFVSALQIIIDNFID